MGALEGHTQASIGGDGGERYLSLANPHFKRG